MSRAAFGPLAGSKRDAGAESSPPLIMRPDGGIGAQSVLHRRAGHVNFHETSQCDLHRVKADIGAFPETNNAVEINRSPKRSAGCAAGGKR